MVNSIWQDKREQELREDHVYGEYLEDPEGYEVFFED